MANLKLTVEEIQRFWSKVDRSCGPDVCWPWLGCKFSSGYGAFGLMYQNRKANRIAWLIEHGTLDERSCVCLRCNNKACVNPAHLFLTNQAGASSKGGLAQATKPRTEIHVAFWARVGKGAEHECWPWKGPRFRVGYGAFSWNGRRHVASRIAWTLSNGTIPSGLFVCHHCDNPPCCNPAHLFLGTNRDNIADMDRKGRRVILRGDTHWTQKHPDRIPRGHRHWTHRITDAHPRGADHWAAKLTEEKVRIIKHALGAGETCLSIGRRFGVRESTIHWIKRGKTWKHVQ
jgi:hypothetical protein